MSQSSPRRGLTRRDALRVTAAGTSAALLGPSLFGGLAARDYGRGVQGRRMILLWLEGGPSQMETFDPKPGTDNGGPLGAIPTDAQDWMISETLPKLAKRAEHLAVLRGMTSREGNHSRARELVKTGYTPNPSVSLPSIGAIVSHELGNPEFTLPHYIQVGGAPSPSGHLGIEHAPLVISDPNREIDNLQYARGVSQKRMDHRTRILEVLEKGFEKRGGEPAVDANRSLREKARRLMDTNLRTTFDLSEERESTRDKYGNTRFGQGCLLARRLVESGVSAVEVVLGGWDTHDDNFNRCQALGTQLDTGFSALIDDLQQRDLWDETVVVCMGEFGRTPRIANTDGRNHWPRNWCVALAGGAIKTGQAHGVTDPTGETIVEGETTVPDLHATLAHALGFDGDREFWVRNRPITLVDSEGKVIREVVKA